MPILDSSGGGEPSSLVNLVIFFVRDEAQLLCFRYITKIENVPLHEYLSVISKGTIEVIDDPSLLSQTNGLSKSEEY